MKRNTIVLNDFHVRRLNVNWRDGRTFIETKREISLGFDFDAASRDGHPHEFKLELRIQGKPVDQCAGIEIESYIDGFFSFPEGTDEKDMQYLLAVNGSSILYGILRGQIAMITGAFPYGKFILPAVVMEEVIPEIIKEKQRERLESGRKKE